MCTRLRMRACVRVRALVHTCLKDCMRVRVFVCVCVCVCVCIVMLYAQVSSAHLPIIPLTHAPDSLYCATSSQYERLRFLTCMCAGACRAADVIDGDVPPLPVPHSGLYVHLAFAIGQPHFSQVPAIPSILFDIQQESFVMVLNAL